MKWRDILFVGSKVIFLLIIFSLFNLAHGFNFHSDWMANLPIESQEVPLTEMAIPGSHDSATYSLKQDEIFAKGLQQENMAFADFIQTSSSNNLDENTIGNIIYRWSKTQDLNITQQLQNGIRYLDLRLAFDRRRICRVVHGLFGTSFKNILQQVQQFIEKHSREVIMLDLRHIYTEDTGNRTSVEEIQGINQEMREIFQSRIAFSDNFTAFSLAELWHTKIQVLAFFSFGHVNKRNSIRHDLIRSPFDYKKFTQSSSWLHFLDLNYETKRRAPNTFYVTQGIMQPHWMEILVAGISEKATLKDWVSDEATRTISVWLKDKETGRNGINIVIADFIEYHNFTDAVLELNIHLHRKRSSNSWNLYGAFKVWFLLLCVVGNFSILCS